MNRLRTLPRRTAAALVGVLVGLAAAVAFATPAGADQVDLSGDCLWDADAGTWQVTWTLTGAPPDGADSYRLNQVDATPDGASVEGIEVTPDDGDAHDAHLPLAGEQRLPEATTSVSLSLQIEWDNGQTDDTSSELTIPADCEVPAPPVDLGQWSVDCQTLTVTIDNTTGADLALTFAPSAGAPVDVELADGESTTVGFPATEGLSVDILFDDRSIVDPDQPIHLTATRWAELDCETNGGGGDLPATGAPTGLIVAGALALLGLGAGLFLIAWRRRIIFTA